MCTHTIHHFIVSLLPQANARYYHQYFFAKCFLHCKLKPYILLCSSLLVVCYASVPFWFNYTFKYVNLSLPPNQSIYSAIDMLNVQPNLSLWLNLSKQKSNWPFRSVCFLVLGVQMLRPRSGKKKRRMSPESSVYVKSCWIQHVDTVPEECGPRILCRRPSRRERLAVC